MKIPAIIVDIDDTFVDAKHKKKFVLAGDWEAFTKASEEDMVNPWCKNIIEALNYHVLFVTGRGDEMYEQTHKFLEDNLNDTDFSLYMRKEGDKTEDTIIKKEIYKTIIEPTFDVEFVLEDRQRLVDMYRELGLVVLQCDVGDF